MLAKIPPPMIRDQNFCIFNCKSFAAKESTFQMTFAIRLILVAVLMLQAACMALGQDRRATLVGTVRAAEDSLTLSEVFVRVIGSSAFALTDAKGFFRLENLPRTQVTVVFERGGVARKVVSLELTDVETRIEVFLNYASFKSSEVVVTAKENAQGGELGTVSRIERSAIEHVQASSLADVLQLLPGQLAQNPTLSGVRQSLLRQSSLSTSASNPSAADRANALGTAIVLDGVPLSNNANLQTNLTILNSPAGTLPPFASAEGRGLDLRQFSADNIESIEVIRGIPSVKHGDLTVGAILVQTRASAYKPQARLRLNPQTVESTLGGGWNFFDKRTGINAELNFTRSQDDPRRTEELFSRLTGNLTWSQQWDAAARLTTTTRAAFYTTLDERLQFANDRQQIERSAQDRGIRASLFSVFRFDDDARTKLEWTASLNYAEQVGQFQELITRGDGRFPLSDATIDTTKPGVFGDIEYLNRTTVQGLPLNVYSRLEAIHKTWVAGWLHQFFFGAEFRLDQNRGDGRAFDVLRPPRQNFTVGERPRAFSEIPALAQVSAYLEDRVATDIFGRAFLAQVGVRFDNIQPTGLFSGRFGAALSPRVNATLELLNGVWLRGGYGTTVKSPTLSQLFPDRKYFDLVGFNYFAPNPAERLTMITTRVIEPQNPNARFFSATKAELGIDVSLGGVTANVVAFREVTDNAFGISRLPVVLTFPRFRVVSTPAGRPPEIAVAAIDTFIAAYDVPVNSRDIHSEGIELTLDLPEWSLVRTSLNITGAYLRSRTTDDALFFNTDVIFGTTPPQRVDVFQSGIGRESQLLTTSARFITRIPELSMVISLLAQTIWIDADRPFNRGTQPIGSLDRQGNLAFLPELPAQSPQAGLEQTRPILWLFNARLTKELPSGIRFAFFVNNVLAERPLFFNTETRAATQRNPTLFFGAEVFYSFQ